MISVEEDRQLKSFIGRVDKQTNYVLEMVFQLNNQ